MLLFLFDDAVLGDVKISIPKGSDARGTPIFHCVAAASGNMVLLIMDIIEIKLCTEILIQRAGKEIQETW